MSAEGRVITLYYKVKLAPIEDTPISSETDGAGEIATSLLETGSAKLKEAIAVQDYSAEISTAYFIF